MEGRQSLETSFIVRFQLRLRTDRTDAYDRWGRYVAEGSLHMELVHVELLRQGASVRGSSRTVPENSLRVASPGLLNNASKDSAWI